MEKEEIRFDSARVRTGKERFQLGFLSVGAALILLITFLAQGIFVPLINQYAPFLWDYSWFALIFSSACMYLVAMPLSLTVFAFCKTEKIEKRKMTFLTWLSVLGICMVLTSIGAIIGTIANGIFSFFRGVPNVNPVETTVSDGPLWATFLVVVILAPIMEELFFRKIVIDRLRRYGDLTAILLSGLLFGLVHGNFSQFFYAAMLGVVFGFVYCNTGRLRYTIALHMTINFIGGIYSQIMLKNLQPFLDHGWNGLGSSFLGLFMLYDYYLVLGSAFIAIPFSIIYLKKRVRLTPDSVHLTASDWAKAGLLNPGVWILVAVLIYRFFTM